MEIRNFLSKPEPDNNTENTWKGLGFTEKYQAIADGIEKNDPLAKDIYSLYLEITQKLKEAKEESEKITVSIRDNADSLKDKFREYEEKIKRSDTWMVGIVVFFALTFLTTIVLISLDSMKDKDLYSNYNNIYKTLTDQTITQELNIKDIQNSIDLLKARNPYLK